MTQINKPPAKVSLITRNSKHHRIGISVSSIVQESDDKYRSFIENLPVLFYAVEPKPPFSPIYISPAFERFGYPLDEWRTDPEIWLRVIHQDDKDWVFKATTASTKTGKAADYEFRIVALDGSIHWVRDRGCLIRDENNNVVLREGVMLDITDRKLAEEELRLSELRYRNLFENANDIVYVHDLEGNYNSINQAAERVFGYSREEALQMNIRQIAAPEHLKLALNKLNGKIAGAGQTSYEMDCIAKDGHRVTLEINSSAVYNDGVATAVQGIARDITERKTAEGKLQSSEAELRAVFAAMTDVIVVLDRKGQYLKIASTNSSLLYKPAGELLGKTLHEVFPKAKADFFLSNIRKALTNRKSIRMEYDLDINGENFWFAGIISPMMKDSVILVARDITESQLAEEALKISEERYRDLFENANDLIYTHDLEGNFTSLNHAGEVITGYSHSEALTMKISQVVAPEFVETAREMTARKIAGEHTSAYELEIISKLGDRVSLELSTRLIHQNGVPVGVQGIGRDITERKRAEDRLRYNALHDALTDLPNRAEFMNRLRQAITRKQNGGAGRFAVLFLDLDRFKIINDSLGHVVGDKLLVSIARRLKSCIRPNDVVARLGGDEFTILLNPTGDPLDVIGVAERLQFKLSEPFKIDNYEVFTTASVGIIVSDEVERQPEDYLRDADAAMYRAKESGKARYEIFNSEMHVRNMNLLRVETDLRRAVERGEFEVLYQPIVKLETGLVEEFEALIRWRHPVHGLVCPDEFIGVAEETGLIIPIGRWILEESCRQIAEWQSRFPFAVSISVNLSTKQLMHPLLISEVRNILEQTGLDPSQLKLEVTESTVMEHGERSLNVLAALDALGISLSTDDFGTGYSSLSYLQRFPFNRLKIDRSFIDRMDKDVKSGSIVKTILMLGENLGIEVVAEGIETHRQLESLLSLGCTYGQGFLFSKPVNARAAEQLLHTAADAFGVKRPMRLLSLVTEPSEIQQIQ